MSRKKKKQWGLLWLAGWAAIILIGLTMIVGMFCNYRDIRRSEQELAEIRERVELQKEQNDELTRILESGSDLEIIERVARDKLGYAKPNERVFVDVNGQ